MKYYLTFLLLLLCIGGSGALGILSAEYIDRVTMWEIETFYNFVNDTRNEGQYIQDFDTGIWYDIDGLNPDVPPLTINEMGIKNIRDRIIGKNIHSKIADKLFNIFLLGKLEEVK